jgi:hypothetical protein
LNLAPKIRRGIRAAGGRGRHRRRFEAYAPPEATAAAACFLVEDDSCNCRRRMRARVNERPFLHMRGFGLSLAF